MKNKLLNGVAGLLLSIPIALSTFVLDSPTQVHAESNAIEWIQANWLNYPNTTGQWHVNSVNGNTALGSTQNVSWTGYLNTHALKNINATFEFKMIQNEPSGQWVDDDNMGWSFRHTYTDVATNIKNHSAYIFVSNGGQVNGGNLPSGLYKKVQGKGVSKADLQLLQSFSHQRIKGKVYDVKIDVKDEPSGTRIKIWIDGVLLANYLDTNPLPMGGYGPFSISQAYAYYYDINVNGASFLNIPPTTVVSSPSSNQERHAGDVVRLTGYAKDEDARGSLATYYNFDNRTHQLIWNQTQTGENQPFDLKVTIPNDIGYGHHTLNVWAKDSENAESQKNEITFFIPDETKPKLTHTLSNSALAKDNVVINLTATDSESGIKRIKLPNGNYINDSVTKYTVNKNGKYTFMAEDNEGNTQSYTVDVDNIYYDLVLEGTPNPLDNTTLLEWNNPFGLPTTYVLYRKNGNGEWESIPSKSTVKVLNIYPDESGINNTGLSEGQIDLDGNSVPNSGILKTWLLKEGIDDVTIDTVSLSSFNANPSKHLKETNGVWNYDTIFYGMWNLQPERVYPNDTAVEYIRSFIKDGGGFMTSHHTIGYKGLDRGVNKLSNELGVEIFSNQPYNKCAIYSGRDANGNMFPTVSFELLEDVRCDYSSYWPTGNQVKIVKKGLLTEYPFKVGEIGQTYTIPSQHGLNVFGKGEVWMQTVNPKGFSGIPFKEISTSPRTGDAGTNNFYVHTYNNTAIINSGHSFPSITQAETRIIANTLYYLAQTTTETSWVDRMGMDNAPPTEPIIQLVSDNASGADFTLSTEDIGVTSEFLLKARNSKYHVQSNVEKVELKAGLKGYSYVVDMNPNTIPDRIIETDSNSLKIPENKEFYLHVVAIDNAGNMSPVSHYHYVDNFNPILTVTASNYEWTNEEITLTATASDNESGIKGIKLPNGTWIESNKVQIVVNKNGTYTFVAEDFAGNLTTKTIKVDNIDMTPPPVPLITNNQSWTKVSPVSVTITAEADSLSGIKELQYKLEGATSKNWTPYSQTLKISNEGVTKIRARVIDKVGNVSKEAISYVRIDKSIPYNTGITIKLKTE